VSKAEPLEQRTAQALEASRRILGETRRLLDRTSADRARRTRGSPAGAQLTARQREILELLAAGLGTKEIATRLWISTATVRNHVAAILAALGARSRVQAIAEARRRGLL
jgi:DNA-binding NarL/FixJ family response regulator